MDNEQLVRASLAMRELMREYIRKEHELWVKIAQYAVDQNPSAPKTEEFKGLDSLVNTHYQSR